MKLAEVMLAIDWRILTWTSHSCRVYWIARHVSLNLLSWEANWLDTSPGMYNRKQHKPYRRKYYPSYNLPACARERINALLSCRISPTYNWIGSICQEVPLFRRIKKLFKLFACVDLGLQKWKIFPLKLSKSLIRDLAVKVKVLTGSKSWQDHWIHTGQFC